MKKLLIVLCAMFMMPAFASDYMPDNVSVTQQTYHPCQSNSAPCGYKLAPVTVYRGQTVTVKKHYDVYQPRVVYDKVNSYTTVQTCTTCN